MNDFFSKLEAEAIQFCGSGEDNDRAGSRRYLVFDLEYEYDRDRHQAYRTAEGFKGSEEKVRWPFHRIRAASWLPVEIVPGEREPRFGEPAVMTAEDHGEKAIVAALFKQLDANRDCVPVTWGGETKDFAVLRRCAGDFGLIVPAKLRDLRPHARDRIDLCLEVAGGSENVHLPEYAAATSIPSKPSPSKSIGKLITSGDWDKVEEQVRADVLTTAIILIRHLASRGEAEIDPIASISELAAAALEHSPTSRFIGGTLAVWAKGLKSRASLRGLVESATD